MNRSSLPISLNTLKKWWESDDKVLRCTLPYQRHANMWNAITKSNLVWAILADSYIPPIVLLKDEAGVDSKGKTLYTYQVEDGQQRVTNLFSYMNDEFALHSATPEVEVDDTIYDIAGLKFSELSEECQDAIKNYRFSVQALENYTMEEAESLYFNINSGVALSQVQKSKAKLSSELIEFLNNLLSFDFFTQGINISEAQARREDDLLMLLQAMLLLDNKFDSKEYKTISAGACLSYAESIRGNYDDEKRERLEYIVEYLSSAFSNKHKWLRKNNVPVLMVIAQTAIEQEIEAERFRAFINEFSNTENEEYNEASGSGNVKAPKVQQRIRILFLEFCDYFDIEPESIEKPFDDDIPLFLEYGEENEETDSSFEEYMNPPEE